MRIDPKPSGRRSTDKANDVEQSVRRKHWEKVQALFEQALELPETERAKFLEQKCIGDDALRREVESLLDSHASAGAFIDERSLFFSEEDFQNGDEAVPPGQLIGAYRIVREIGRGGMGTVYLAERADEQYQAQAAIKLIGGEPGGASLRQRFLAERQILANLHHPNIAGMLDGGATPEGFAYIVMEYIEGEPIDHYCRE